MSNPITGRLPEELGHLTKLRVLNLGRNQLYGTIPPSLANISSLVTINLRTNFLSGSIPSQLADLPKLKNFDIADNNLSGTVPPNMFNMSSLVTIALGRNRLQGTFPKDIGATLPNLLGFYACFNEFTGVVPPSFHNISKIQGLRFAHNFIHGTVPPGLENLHDLLHYNIGSNEISSSGENGLSFITSLTNSSHLRYLKIDENQLEGVIPDSIGNLSKDLSQLYMGGNRLYGNIPTSIANLRGLYLLNLSDNLLSGEIPPQIGMLDQLQYLGLAKNRLSGNIPSSLLADLPKLNQLDLSGNDLVGSIPTSFGNFRHLDSLNLSNNKLNGSIPKETFTLLALSKLLDLSNNLLSGLLPEEIGSLENIATVDVTNNHISGNIPPTISSCKSLEILKMAQNKFSGPVPRDLGQLRGLRGLDLSSNHLSGSIPIELQNMSGLQFLNLSFNDLEGVIPRAGAFEHANVYLQGNSKLCSYYTCQENGSKDTNATKIIVFSIVFSTIALCVIFAKLIYNIVMRRKSKIEPLIELSRGQNEMVSYDDLRLATKNFSQMNLVGKGSFGSVYTGNLKQGMVVAIKVLDIDRTGSVRSFLAECEALRNVRHRNLVKLITSCSSIDFSNKEFRALVYEFLSNGNLDEWINGHRNHESGNGLDILERLNIVIDVASVLDYLHHGCEVPIVHCDLKPSNILLDANMTAKVGDFGLARMLKESTSNQSSNTSSSTHVLRGSIGYLPPEYGFGGKASIAGDVYSFGITLLELFTGKGPTHEHFTEDLNLVKWIESRVSKDVIEIVDSKLLEFDLDLGYQGRKISSDMQKDCLLEVIGVGLSCTVNSPMKRLNIKDALSKLITAKDSLILSQKRSYMN